LSIFEIINKKKQGMELTAQEINTLIADYTTGKIPDYQMSALLMAICLKGMTTRETTGLTMAMANSGDVMDLSSLTEKGGKTLDKHSTGGVGDKTTFIVSPIMAALGYSIGKMSGRGLGHTGGTIDKLESIPGLRTELSTKEFLDITARHGLCISGQSGNLVPADKKMYALRDVTATVDSIPLIAASIMSKKIAAGAEYILLDVKTGSGAFMKDLESARELARAMVDIGNGCGRKTAALITDMSVPLGCAIGNSLEIIEAVQVLKCDPAAPADIAEVSASLAAHLLHMVEGGDLAACREKVEEVLRTGVALAKFADMVEAQGGDRKYIEDPTRFENAKNIVPVKSPKSGFVSEMDTRGIGVAAMMLGAGRETAEDTICHSAGVYLYVKPGGYIKEGEMLALLHTNNDKVLAAAEEKLLASIKFSQSVPQEVPLIHAIVS